jgi:hypothetical protein
MDKACQFHDPARNTVSNCREFARAALAATAAPPSAGERIADVLTDPAAWIGPAASPANDAPRLPCDVRVGAVVFRKGVTVSALQGKLDRDVAAFVRAQYPEDVFPENGTSLDSKSARMARLTCDNILRRHAQLVADARDAFQTPAAPASAPLTPFAEDAHTLAALAIQSDRYGSDPEFRDAVDNVLNQTKRAAFQTPAAPAAESLEKALDVISEVAACDIDHSTRRYHVVQIDRETWDEVQRLADTPPNRATVQPAACPTCGKTATPYCDLPECGLASQTPAPRPCACTGKCMKLRGEPPPEGRYCAGEVQS